MEEENLQRFTFSKNEKLCSQKDIQKLFQEGNSFLVYPYRILWLKTKNSETPHCHVLISVSKRNFKHAVTRNLIKRRIREAYRLNKSILLEHLTKNHTNISLAIVYVGMKVEDFNLFQNKIIVSLKRLIEALGRFSDAKE